MVRQLAMTHESIMGSSSYSEIGKMDDDYEDDYGDKEEKFDKSASCGGLF